MTTASESGSGSVTSLKTRRSIPFDPSASHRFLADAKSTDSTLYHLPIGSALLIPSTPASGAPVSSSTGHPIVFAMQKWTPGRNSGNGSESLVDILGIVRVLPAGLHNAYKYHEFTMSLILALNNLNQRTVSYLLSWVDQSRLRLWWSLVPYYTNGDFVRSYTGFYWSFDLNCPGFSCWHHHFNPHRSPSSWIVNGPSFSSCRWFVLSDSYSYNNIILAFVPFNCMYESERNEWLDAST